MILEVSKRQQIYRLQRLHLTQLLYTIFNFFYREGEGILQDWGQATGQWNAIWEKYIFKIDTNTFGNLRQIHLTMFSWLLYRGRRHSAGWGPGDRAMEWNKLGGRRQDPSKFTFSSFRSQSFCYNIIVIQLGKTPLNLPSLTSFGSQLSSLSLNGTNKPGPVNLPSHNHLCHVCHLCHWMISTMRQDPAV